MKPRILALIFAAGCGVSPPAAESPVVHVRYDPKTGVLPKPNDLLRDAAAKRLDIPATPKDLASKTPAEAALIQALDTRDGWPSRTAIEVELSAPIRADSIGPDTVRLFEVAPDGIRSLDAAPAATPADAPTKLTIDAPSGGWARGRTYFAAAIGGEKGLRGAGGEPVVADPAFLFLRSKGSLLDHVDALPGDTREDKLSAATRLERTRIALAPFFAHLEKIGVARADIAALWSFTITESPEVIMDKATSQMPVPSDFLRDPATGRVDLPIAATETQFEKDAKRALRDFDGFSLSASLVFELSAPIDEATLTPEAVRLYAAPKGVPEAVQVPLRFSTRDGGKTVICELAGPPLDPETDHLLVLTHALEDSAGHSVAPMLPGLITLLDTPVYTAGASNIPAVDGESAAKLEFVRNNLSSTLGAIKGLARKDIAVAWPFRTMGVAAPMRAARDAAATTGISPDPVDVTDRSAASAALDFPIGALTVFRIGKVIEGSILIPDRLDPITRRNRADGGWEPRRVRFMMTIPRGADTDKPLRVAIFGHGLMTERRFVLALGDPLAAEGLAAIAIDFPYHGDRTHCIWRGPQCIVNPLDQGGDPICPLPCELGTMCAEDGRCVDNSGRGNHLARWPIVGFPQASGGAFVDIDDIAGTRDHFYQAITDLNALLRSLRQGDWKKAIGYQIDPRIGYVGQSLGGIVGATFVATNPSIERVVLNVPGSDLIELYSQSAIFRSHMDAFIVREHLVPGSTKHELALDVARWIMDAVDPQSFAKNLALESFEPSVSIAERKILIQMATLDLVIPNAVTRLLASLSGVRKVDYVAEHAFIVVPVEPAYLRGSNDVANLLGKGDMP